DFLKMQRQMKMLGSFDQLLGMIPGINISKDDKEKILHEGEKQFKRIEVMRSSMTPQERNHPELLNSSRKRRIAEGSGISLHDLNIFIKQFEQMRSMMKGMSDMKKSLGKFKGMNPALGMKKMMQTMRRFR
ncbi:MAG: signal recognition particle protein, partial [Candidatus Gastranaerophilaceae bacterium]